MVADRRDADVACPECGTACSRQGSRTRPWRHLDTLQYKTVLPAEVPRVRCGDHGIRQIQVPWADERSCFTALFESSVIHWLREASISGVADLVNLTWDEAAGTMGRAVQRRLGRRTLSVPPVIGVDETSVQKRHEYVTVLCYPASHTVLHVCDGRSAACLSETRRGVAATDDERIVFDKLHVAQLVGGAVNRARLSELKATNLKVDRAWAIKETLMDAFHFQRPKQAEQSLRDVLAGWPSPSFLPSRGSPRRSGCQCVAQQGDSAEFPPVGHGPTPDPANPGNDILVVSSSSDGALAYPPFTQGMIVGTYWSGNSCLLPVGFKYSGPIQP